MITQRPESASTNVTHDLLQAAEDFFIKDLQLTLDSPVVATQYLSTSGLIGLGCQDGTTRILSSSKKAVQYTLVKQDKSPVMSIASTSPTSTIKNTIMVAHAEGTLEYWHATSNQLLFQKHYETTLQSCQISNNNEWYVVSEGDGNMLFGHLDKGNPTTLQTGNLGSHSNRVFCIKWHPEDVNTFFSGGWDKAVFMWDVRTKTAVKSLYGYFIGGQAIDVKENQVLLGNNQNQFQLRVYDIKSDKVRKIEWQHYSKSSQNSITGVNSCYFGKQNDQVLALSSRNQLRFFRNDKCLSMFRHSNIQAQGFSMSISTTQKVIVASWNTGDVKIMAY